MGAVRKILRKIRRICWSFLAICLTRLLAYASNEQRQTTDASISVEDVIPITMANGEAITFKGSDPFFCALKGSELLCVFTHWYPVHNVIGNK